MSNYWKQKKKYKKRAKFKKQKPKLSKLDKVVIEAQNQVGGKAKIQKLEAHGIAIHTIVNQRTSSLLLRDVKDYNDANLEDRVELVELARKLRSFEGICSTVADLLVDFGAARGMFRTENVELQALLNRWMNFVNSPPVINLKGIVFPVSGLREVSRKIIDDYLTDGDAIFTLFWQNNVKMDIEIDKKGFFLPVSIKLLDTLSLKIDEDLAKFGIERLELKLADEVIAKIQDPQDEASKFLAKNLPKEWKKFISAGDPIILDPNVTFHIKRNGKDYRPWGESLFTKSFTAIANKRRLQAVDEATIDGLINRFTIFKVGLADQEKNPAYHIPSAARVASLVDTVTSPKRTNAMVWAGPDLEVEDIGPDGKILEFTDKYKQVDLDILRSLHVSPLLIDGASAGQAVRDWAAFLSTEVGLDSIRNKLEQVYTSIGKEIAVTNKMKFEQLEFNFENLLLKDEKRVRNFALKVFELGAISIETFVKIMGYNFESEKILKERELQEGLDKIFVNRTLPFQGNPGDEGASEVVKKEEGRPPQTTNEDEGKESSPKTQDINNTSAKAQIKDTKEIYGQIYATEFDKIKRDIIRKIEKKPDLALLDLSLISGFLTFKGLVEIQLKDVYYREVGRRIVSKELEALISWNDRFIDDFFRDLRAELASSIDDIQSFTNVLDAQKYRVSLYAQESHRKAEFMGQVNLAKEKGFTVGRWKTTFDDVTCPICEGNHNKVFKIDTLVRNFPAHPNCRCEVELFNNEV